MSRATVGHNEKSANIQQSARKDTREKEGGATVGSLLPIRERILAGRTRCRCGSGRRVARCHPDRRRSSGARRSSRLSRIPWAQGTARAQRAQPRGTQALTRAPSPEARTSARDFRGTGGANERPAIFAEQETMMTSNAKSIFAFGVGFAAGWAARSLSDSPSGVGVRLLEIAMQAKDRIGRWAALERERLEDMLAEARSRVESDSSGSAGATDGSGNRARTGNGEA